MGKILKGNTCVITRRHKVTKIKRTSREFNMDIRVKAFDERGIDPGGPKSFFIGGFGKGVAILRYIN